MKLFLLAGEPSGDALGAALMRALRAEAGGVTFEGVGGPLMRREGLDSLFPQEELAVMGLVEVLPRLPGLLRRLRETAEAAVAARPAAIVTIDAPSFGLRVQDRARAMGSTARAIHYVAPQVWAWRPGRARKLAGRLDLLLALLPFEPAFFEEYGLPCAFVGHPAAARPRAGAAEIAALRQQAGAGPETPLLVVLPGSRAGEARRHLGPFGETVARLAERRPGLRVVVPTVPGVADPVRAATAGWAAPTLTLDPEADDAEAVKRAAMAGADAALAASGTATLELAVAGAPMAVGYRANPITAALVRRLATVETACLVNIVAEEKAIPEFLQEELEPDAVAAMLDRLMADGPERARQRAAFDRVLAALGRDGPPPETRAAQAILAEVAGRR